MSLGPTPVQRQSWHLRFRDHFPLQGVAVLQEVLHALRQAPGDPDATPGGALDRT